MHINNLYFYIKPNILQRVVISAVEVNNRTKLRTGIQELYFILTTDFSFPLGTSRLKFFSCEMGIRRTTLLPSRAVGIYSC